MDDVVGDRTALILIVDDHRDLLETMASIIEWEGYRVKTATSAAEAFGVLQLEPPALMLLDLNMPEVDGFDVLARLRREGLTMKVVMMTAMAEDYFRERAFKLGACDYIVKGRFDLNELLACIDRHLAAA